MSEVRDSKTPRGSISDLVGFHSRQKLLLMAHDPGGARAMGRLVAGARASGAAAAWSEYFARFHDVRSRPATRGRHVNVLQHLAGHLKTLVSDEDRVAIARAIDLFAQGRAERGVPLRLLRVHAERHRVGYLLEQAYWEEPFSDV